MAGSFVFVVQLIRWERTSPLICVLMHNAENHLFVNNWKRYKSVSHRFYHFSFDVKIKYLYSTLYPEIAIQNKLFQTKFTSIIKHKRCEDKLSLQNWINLSRQTSFHNALTAHVWDGSWVTPSANHSSASPRLKWHFPPKPLNFLRKTTLHKSSAWYNFTIPLFYFNISAQCMSIGLKSLSISVLKTLKTNSVFSIYRINTLWRLRVTI